MRQRHETATILRKIAPAPSLLWLAKLNVHEETGKSLLLAVHYAGRAGWVASVTNLDMRGQERLVLKTPAPPTGHSRWALACGRPSEQERSLLDNGRGGEIDEGWQIARVSWSDAPP